MPSTATLSVVAARRSCRLFLPALLLLLRTSEAFKVQPSGGGYGDEKVPLAVIVPDPSPKLSALPPARAPAPLASSAPPPVYGGGDDDMRPRLPTERWPRARGRPGELSRPARQQRHRPAPAPAPGSSAPARAPAPDSGSGGGGTGTGTASIKSSPAVPVPRGVTDTATILPMPAPGEKRQEVGAATSVRAGGGCMALGFIIMASFWL